MTGDMEIVDGLQFQSVEKRRVESVCVQPLKHVPT